MPLCLGRERSRRPGRAAAPAARRASGKRAAALEGLGEKAAAEEADLSKEGRERERGDAFLILKCG